MLELNSILSDIQYSRTNGIPYCLSNDIGLILIIEKSSEGAELEEIEICNQEELMDAKNVENAIVSGFPNILCFMEVYLQFQGSFVSPHSPYLLYQNANSP